jgi:hypothetical protein
VAPVPAARPTPAPAPPRLVIEDGSANVRRGTPQHPHLLTPYIARPPWKVAGVDYAVGVTSGTVLKKPTMISVVGVSLDHTNHLIRVGDNVTLSDYDFTGWSIYITGRNVTIQNSYAKGASMIYGTPESANVTIRNCELDGRGSDGWSLITLSGKGHKVVQYNWLHHSPQHFLELNHGGQLNYSYNLIEAGGVADPGAHVNYLQMQGGPYVAPVISFNTMYQTKQPAGGEMIQVKGSDGLVANNTMIAVPGSAGEKSISYMINVEVGDDMADSFSGQVENNYMAPHGAYGAFYPITALKLDITLANNVNMITGNIIQAENTERRQRSRD